MGLIIRPENNLTPESEGLYPAQSSGLGREVQSAINRTVATRIGPDWKPTVLKGSMAIGGIIIGILYTLYPELTIGGVATAGGLLTAKEALKLLPPRRTEVIEPKFKPGLGDIQDPLRLSDK